MLQGCQNQSATTTTHTKPSTHTNALKNESSPYLLQHAHNPVNWYPWKAEALEKAKKEHKCFSYLFSGLLLNYTSVPRQPAPRCTHIRPHQKSASPKIGYRKSAL